MKNKILFITPYPFDTAPSQRFRFEQYIATLEKNDYQIYQASFLDLKGWNTVYKEGSAFKKIVAFFRSFMRRWALMFRLKKYDFIFIHREASMIGPPIFEWIIAKVLRRKYIYDFDDAIWLPNYSESNARFHRLKRYQKIRNIIKWADVVVAGNDYLKNYAEQFNVNTTIIPTTIDTENVHNLDGNPDNNPIIIGWTGTHTTVNYIVPLLPVLDRIFEKQPFELLIISNQPPNFKRTYLRFLKWRKESEISDLSTINIGIMPMEDNEWTKGKCGFKGLQYMSLKIPAVLSPVGVNTSIIIHGDNGFLCKTPDDWEKTLLNLISDAALREKIGTHGKLTIENHYSTKHFANEYINLFRK